MSLLVVRVISIRYIATDLGLLNRVDPLSDYYLDVLAHNVVTLATAVNTCECSASKIWYKNYKNDIIYYVLSTILMCRMETLL